MAGWDTSGNGQGQGDRPAWQQPPAGPPWSQPPPAEPERRPPPPADPWWPTSPTPQPAQPTPPPWGPAPQHLGGGPPTDEGQRSTRRLVAVITVLAFLVAVVGGLVVLTRSDGDGEVAAEDETTTTTEEDAVEPPPVDEEELEDRQRTSTTAPPVGPADVPLVAFTDEEGGYSLMVPETWGYASIGGDVAGVGAEAFPDDPMRADVFEEMATTMPRQMVFLAVDPELMSSRQLPSNVNVVAVPEQRPLDPGEVEEFAVDQLETLGADVNGSEVVAMGPGDGVRLEYEIAEGSSVGLMYVVLVDGMMWSITCSAAELEPYLEMFDDVGSSFVLL